MEGRERDMLNSLSQQRQSQHAYTTAAASSAAYNTFSTRHKYNNKSSSSSGGEGGGGGGGVIVYRPGVDMGPGLLPTGGAAAAAIDAVQSTGIPDLNLSPPSKVSKR